MAKSDAQRTREYRERQRAKQNKTKKPAKSAAQRAREYRERKKMPVSCAVSACRNQHIQTKRQGKDIRYMNFPMDRGIRKIWVERCDRGNDWEPRFSRMCSIHFTDDDYERDLKAELLGTTPKKILKKTAIPSRFLSKDYSEEDTVHVEPNKRQEYKQIVNQLLKTPPRSYGKGDKKAATVTSRSYAIAVDSIKIEPMDEVEDFPLDEHDEVESILPDIPDVPNLAIVKKEPIDDTEEVLPSLSQSISAVQSSSSSTLSLKPKKATSEHCVDEMTIPINPADIAPPSTLTGSTNGMKSLPYTCRNDTEPLSKIANISPASNRVLFVVPENSPASYPCTDSIKPSSNTQDLSHGSKRLVLIVPENSTTPFTCGDDIEPSGKRTDLSHVAIRPVFGAPESSTMLNASRDETEPPPKRPNLSQSPPTRNIEIKDDFSVFGDFVTAKIRSFTDRRLQVEAQHLITNILFEIEMKDLKNSLPVKSGISSLQTTSSSTVTVPSSSAINEISSLLTETPSSATAPSSSAINMISSLQTQMPATVTLPFNSNINWISSLQKQLPGTATLSSSSAISSIPNFQVQLPGTETLCSDSTITSCSSLQTALPEPMTLPSSSAVKISSSQTIFPPPVTLPSSSAMSKISSLQTALSETTILPSSLASKISSLGTIFPPIVTLSSSSLMNNMSSLQTSLPTIVTLPSSTTVSVNSGLQTPFPTALMIYSTSGIDRISSLQTEMPAAVTLPSSSAVPIAVSSTSANTVTFNTQGKPL